MKRLKGCHCRCDVWSSSAFTPKTFNITEIKIDLRNQTSDAIQRGVIAFCLAALIQSEGPYSFEHLHGHIEYDSKICWVASDSASASTWLHIVWEYCVLTMIKSLPLLQSAFLHCQIIHLIHLAELRGIVPGLPYKGTIWTIWKCFYVDNVMKRAIFSHTNHYLLARLLSSDNDVFII